jgi:hypothetical protein
MKDCNCSSQSSRSLISRLIDLLERCLCETSKGRLRVFEVRGAPLKDEVAQLLGPYY